MPRLFFAFFLAARLSSPAQAQLGPDDLQRGLVASFPLDGDARDALGGAGGTLGGTRPAEDRNGNPRGALAFSGKDHADLGVRVEPERFGLAVWIRPSRRAAEPAGPVPQRGEW